MVKHYNESIKQSIRDMLGMKTGDVIESQISPIISPVSNIYSQSFNVSGSTSGSQNVVLHTTSTTKKTYLRNVTLSGTCISSAGTKYVILTATCKGRAAIAQVTLYYAATLADNQSIFVEYPDDGILLEPNTTIVLSTPADIASVGSICLTEQEVS